MSQTDKIRDKLLLQFERVSRKFKSAKNEREVSNSEVQIASYQYFTGGAIDDSKLEWLHDRLVRLDQVQMELYRMRFEKAMTLDEIAENLGMAKSSVSDRLNKVFDILRRD